MVYSTLILSLANQITAAKKQLMLSEASFTLIVPIYHTLVRLYRKLAVWICPSSSERVGGHALLHGEGTRVFIL